MSLKAADFRKTVITASFRLGGEPLAATPRRRDHLK
jgi:hypothetical protein